MDNDPMSIKVIQSSYLFIYLLINNQAPVK